MLIQNKNDLICLKEIGYIVALTLNALGKHIKPGISTKELDEIGGKILSQHNAQSAPKLCYNFPGYTCISINHQAAHGIPGNYKIQPGDVVNIDVSAEKNGYFADSGYTFLVPPINPTMALLCEATQKALYNAMDNARADTPINLIGNAIHKTACQYGFTVLFNLSSHGVGLTLHEEPTNILNYCDYNDKRILQQGQVITIEPFLSIKDKNVYQHHDGWTLCTSIDNRTAQFEHSMIINKDEKPTILTELAQQQ